MLSDFIPFSVSRLAAIAIFSRLIAQYPRYAEAYYNRGVAQRKLGNDKAAIADYNQALKINSKLAEAYQERGLLWPG